MDDWTNLVNVIEKLYMLVEPMKGSRDAVGKDLACPKFSYVTWVEDNDNPI